MYATIEEAMMALRENEQAVKEDLGEQAVEAAWADLVNDVASCCPLPVGQELRRRNGL